MLDKINIIDVGAAGGIDPLFNILEKYGVEHFLFEPNKIEFSKLKKKYKSSKNVNLFNLAISKTKAKRKFFNFGSSSSLKFSLYLKDKKYFTSTVNTTQLDRLKSQTIIPSPDILKVDTEGSEYDVLVGGKNVLKGEVLCVKLEFQFYNSLKSNDFCSLNNFLSQNNFSLVGMCYSEAINSALAGGDLLYFKNINDKIYKKKSKLLKMIKICDSLGRLHFFPDEFLNKSIEKFSDEEKKFIFDLKKSSFLLNRSFFYFPRVSSFLFFLSIFFMGKKYRTKTAPKLNQLRGYKKLYFRNFLLNFRKLL